MAAAAETLAAPTTPLRELDLAAEEIPVGSPAGSQAGATLFDVGTPAQTARQEGERVGEEGAAAGGRDPRVSSRALLALSSALVASSS